MTLTAIDTNSILVTYFKTQSTLTDLTTTARIYGPPGLPADFTIQPAVSFFTSGGNSDLYVTELRSPSKTIKCWGSTPVEARQVYRALYQVLQGIERVTVESNIILCAEQEVEGQDLIDPDTDWPFVLTFFKVMMR